MATPKSGNPSKKAAGGRTTPKKASAGVTSVQEWKKDAKGHELELPSGKVCLVKRASITTFLSSGKADVPNPLVSSILPLLEEAQEKGRTGSTEDAVTPEQMDEFRQQALQDPQKLIEMIQLVDDVTVQCVLAPKVHAVADREAIEADEHLTNAQKQDTIESMLFVDEVDENDKMYIFNFVVGGPQDLDRFREATGSALAT